MKKVAVIILALLYITATSGIVVNAHYCMGDLASVTYGQDESDSCGKCGMKERKGCCHSEVKVVKLDDVHQQTVKAENVQLAELPVAFVETVIDSYHSRTNFVNAYHSPPDPRVNSVYLHTNSFRI